MQKVICNIKVTFSKNTICKVTFIFLKINIPNLYKLKSQYLTRSGPENITLYWIIGFNVTFFQNSSTILSNFSNFFKRRRKKMKVVSRVASAIEATKNWVDSISIWENFLKTKLPLSYAKNSPKSIHWFPGKIEITIFLYPESGRVGSFLL